MRIRRGMALITVLMVSLVLLIFLLTGVQITGRNLFTMARSHERNMALYAAEAGIYASMAEFETLNHFPDSASLPAVTLSNGASYQVDVVRDGEDIHLTSTGVAFRAKRKLQVTLRLGADSYQAVQNEGIVSLEDDTFVNGVQSTLNPKPDRGNLHTNSGDPAAIRPDTSSGTDPRLSATGKASAQGGITATVVGHSQPGAGSIPPVQLNRDSLLGSATYTTVSNLPSDGVVQGHMRIDGDLDYTGAIQIPEGAVLHVTGDCAIGRGITGSGTLVVDGECLIRASDNLDLGNARGVVTYAERGVSLIHPEAQRQTVEVTQHPDPNDPQTIVEESVETFSFEPDPLAEFFASRPTDTEFNLRQGLPLEAPADLEFFEYYERELVTGSEGFQLWLNGDGTDLNPGVRPEIKQWLQKAQDPVIKDRLRQARQQ